MLTGLMEVHRFSKRLMSLISLVSLIFLGKLQNKHLLFKVKSIEIPLGEEGRCWHINIQVSITVKTAL